ncbi:MAG: hypothetical protein N3B13_06005, partial [Deltaproteobacteria bacterium]|nr:hypothetical protein [Deltaproteobacteria bacterium]
MKEFTIETEKDTISSYITLNLATYPEYRLELLKKTKLLLKSDYLVIIRNADFTVPHSDYQRYTPMRKILLFLSDFYSLMNKYPHQISFENKSIKLSTLTNENTLFESILRITSLLKLDEKTDVSETSEVKKEEHLVQNNNAIHYPDINQSYLNAELELMEKGYRRAGKYECNSINEAKTANYIISQIFPYTEIVCRENNQADIYYSIFKKHLDEIIKSDNILSNTDIKRSGYL